MLSWTYRQRSHFEILIIKYVRILCEVWLTNQHAQSAPLLFNKSFNEYTFGAHLHIFSWFMFLLCSFKYCLALLCETNEWKLKKKTHTPGRITQELYWEWATLIRVIMILRSINLNRFHKSIVERVSPDRRRYIRRSKFQFFRDARKQFGLIAFRHRSNC